MKAFSLPLRSLIQAAAPRCGVWRAITASLAVMAALLAVAGLGGASLTQQGASSLAPVRISAQRRQLIGLTFATVEEKELTDRIQTTGFVEPDERREGYVQTRIAGWVKRVFVNQTYQHVRPGQPLFTIYSRELVSAEEEYLLALKTERDLRQSDVKGVASGAESLIKAARARLRLFGLPAREIERLERERTSREELEIDSPLAGYVLQWSALPNKYVDPDARLYTIVDLSTVWIYGAIFQDRIGDIKIGDPVSVTVDAYPGRVFRGTVDFIWQSIDPATRTARVRCALRNPDGLLKLGMYVNLLVEARLGRALIIPDSAVLRTGKRDIVFIDEGDGYLQPTEVELGSYASHQFVALKGLKPGDRVVNSANFLVDSESQLQAAMGTFAPPPPGASAAARAPTGTIEITTKPNPPSRGVNQVLITVRDSTGRSVTGAEVVVVFFMPAMPAMGMSAMRVEASARPAANGLYVAEVNLPRGGMWNVSVVASQGGKQIASRQLTMSVSGGM